MHLANAAASGEAKREREQRSRQQPFAEGDVGGGRALGVGPGRSPKAHMTYMLAAVDGRLSRQISACRFSRKPVRGTDGHRPCQ